ncbi:MAG: BON domain-containing protein [Rhodospirillales bacterium]|nr:BON domain-containing protein [Rhodospirillales bacterium]
MRPLAASHSIRLISRIFVCIGLVTMLSNCAGVLIGAGATVGVAAYQERGIEGVAHDTKLATQIRAAYLEADGTLATNIGVEVYERRALLTGLIENDALRAHAVQIAWSVDGIKDVLNEIQIKNEEGIVEFAYDSWISAQLKTKMTFDADILAINYSVETVNSVVYLIGIAQDQVELDRVLAHARSIDRVRRVISHVRLKDVGS